MQLVMNRSVAPAVLGPSLNPRNEVMDLIHLGFEIETGEPVTVNVKDGFYSVQLRRGTSISVVARSAGSDPLSIDFGLDLRSTRGAAIVNEGGTIIFRENCPQHFIKTSFGFYVVDWSGRDMTNRQLKPRIPTFDSCVKLLGLDPQQVLTRSKVLSSPTIW